MQMSKVDSLLSIPGQVLRFSLPSVYAFALLASVCADIIPRLVAIHGALGRFIGRLWANVSYRGAGYHTTCRTVGQKKKVKGFVGVTVSINRRRKMSSRGTSSHAFRMVPGGPREKSVFDTVPRCDAGSDECAAIIRVVCCKLTGGNLVGVDFLLCSMNAPPLGGARAPL